MASKYCLPAQTSPELIFHIINMFQDSSVICGTFLATTKGDKTILAKLHLPWNEQEFHSLEILRVEMKQLCVINV